MKDNFRNKISYISKKNSSPNVESKNSIEFQTKSYPKKYELTPIKSESSIFSDKLYEESEKSSNDFSLGGVRKFIIKGTKLTLNKKEYLEDMDENIYSIENNDEYNFINENNYRKKKDLINKNDVANKICKNNYDNNYPQNDEYDLLKGFGQNKIIMHTKDKDHISEKNKNSYLQKNQTLKNVMGYTPFIDEKKEINLISNTSKLLKKAFPLMIAMLVQTIEFNISLILFSNYYNDVKLLSVLGIVDLYIKSLIIPFVVPMEETLNILGSTALAANKINTLSNIFLKTLFFSFFIGLFFVTSNIFIFKPLLYYLNFEDFIVNESYNFFINMIPFIIFENTLFINFTYMNILKAHSYIYLINFIKLIIHFMASYLFIIYWGFSISGYAYSFTITYSVSLLICYYFQRKIQKDIEEEKDIEIKFEINNKIFIGLKSFLKLSAITILIMVSEGWADEILNFFASKISYEEFSVYSIVYKHLWLFFDIEMGICISTSIIISKFLGKIKDTDENYIKDLKRILYYCFIFVSGFYFIMYFSVFLLSDYNSQYYFSEIKYQQSFAYNLKFFSFVSYFQGIFLYLKEILLNLKNQNTEIFISIFIGYGIKISLAYVLVFWYNYGLMGIYFSIFISSLIGILIVLSFIWRIDYNVLKEDIIRYLDEEEEEEMKMEQEIAMIYNE